MTSDTAILAVERFLAVPFVLIGLSHVLQPKLWIDFFERLEAQGRSATIWRTFTLELWPAVLIVGFHQDWSWPGVLLTIYGHALLLKISLSLLAPDLGRGSLGLATAWDGMGMQIAGLILVGLGLLCARNVLAQAASIDLT
ncbi:MAG: hypothetical protein AAF871_02475 [Pseudomonadota bacterium]